jgi:hypothetical protein
MTRRFLLVYISALRRLLCLLDGLSASTSDHYWALMDRHVIYADMPRAKAEEG